MRAVVCGRKGRARVPAAGGSHDTPHPALRATFPRAGEGPEGGDSLGAT